MKITRIAKYPTIMQHERYEANIGCDICPCCGEDKEIAKTFYSFQKGFIRKKMYGVDRYFCKKCESRWESECFEININ